MHIVKARFVILTTFQPNYDDIRQAEGFKNVSLGNVLSAKAPNEKIPFIADADLGIYEKYRNPAFEVQVCCVDILKPEYCLHCPGRYP